MRYINIPCNIEEIMHFSENQYLTPTTPNDPNLTFDPIKWIEDLKLNEWVLVTWKYYVKYKRLNISHKNQGVTNWTQVYVWRHKWDRDSQANSYAWVSYMETLCNTEEQMHFSGNQDLTSVTSDDPRLTFESQIW